MRLTETFTKEFYNSEKKLLIYGAGNYGEIALGGLKEIGLTPDYFVDKNHAGELYHQIPVISPQEINRFSQDVFLVASLNYFGEWILRKCACSHMRTACSLKKEIVFLYVVMV